MDSVMHFGLGLGLAGIAGVRAYFPLIVIGLITRFSETLSYRPPLKVFASAPVLILLAVIAAFEILSARLSDSSDNPVVVTAVLRIIGGAIVFSGLFGGFGNVLGFIVGGLLAALSYMIMIRLKQDYKNGFAGRTNSDIGSGVEESSVVVGTLLIILLPWTSFLIWGIIIVAFLKKIREHNRYRPNLKARSWR